MHSSSRGSWHLAERSTSQGFQSTMKPPKKPRSHEESNQTKTLRKTKGHNKNLQKHKAFLNFIFKIFTNKPLKKHTVIIQRKKNISNHFNSTKKKKKRKKKRSNHFKPKKNSSQTLPSLRGLRSPSATQGALDLSRALRCLLDANHLRWTEPFGKSVWSSSGGHGFYCIWFMFYMVYEFFH